MPVSLRIIEDGYVLHYTISDPWEVSELLTAYDEERTHRDSVSHIVHSINDLSGARNIPKNWWSARHGPGLTHPRSGEMVFFGLAPGIKILIDTILTATRYKRIKAFSSADDAWEYVRSLAARSKSESAVNAAK